VVRRGGREGGGQEALTTLTIMKPENKLVAGGHGLPDRLKIVGWGARDTK
jgi:hypothetical protein